MLKTLLREGPQGLPQSPAVWAGWVLSGDPGNVLALAPEKMKRQELTTRTRDDSRAPVQPIAAASARRDWMRPAAWGMLALALVMAGGLLMGTKRKS